MNNVLSETKAFKGMTNVLTGHGNFKFSVGEIYEIDVSKKLKIYEEVLFQEGIIVVDDWLDKCSNNEIEFEFGFHACINLIDCFEYYPNDGDNRFFEVTIFGEYKEEKDTICGRKIRIDKEINLNEVLNGEFVDYYNNKKFYINGELHRDRDLPAIIHYDGTIEYYANGELHRDGDLPAEIYTDGTKRYYKNGKLHRDGDLPAVINSNGTMEYYKNGELYRDGDLPAIIWSDGTKEYYKNGELHRDGDLPAIIWSDGAMTYFKYGKRYRDGDLPAVILPDGTGIHCGNDEYADFAETICRDKNLILYNKW
jgi:antitoxin component YwqK of YwqJK toxin-antitoxin module